MKHLRLAINLIAAFIALVIFNNCGESLGGTFFISDAVRKYEIDTTITSVKFVDNYGISDEFYLDQRYVYVPHHYFSEWGSNGTAWGETYEVAYHSTVNGFTFTYILRADRKHTDLEIQWNYKDRLIFNFGTKTVDRGIKPQIKFYDALTVRGIEYKNIIEVDYTDKINEIDNDTPVKTYISGEKGLIKFVLKDNVVLERIE